MVQDYFNQRKNSVLKKEDKSYIGDWDEKILSLCEKINKNNDFYTTSSCSGRIVLIIDQDKKEAGLFLKQYHDLLDESLFGKDIQEILDKNSSEQIKFKQEPPILHVSCRNMESALDLLKKSKKSGWKNSGIYSITNFNSDKMKIVLELNSTEKMEFPLISDSKLLVGDVFLKKVIIESNKRLVKSWKKIEDLEKLI